jgi:DNA-binding MarR family transcriptional regulator
MPEGTLSDLLERIVLAGVAITTRALTEASPGFDLTFPQWRALVVVGEHPDGMTVSEVARRIGVTLPATSRQLRRLERRGLVILRRDERDRRAARIQLTAGGLATRAAILAFRRRLIADAVSRVPVTEVTLRDLASVVDALDPDRG